MITRGLELPRSGTLKKLKAQMVDGSYHVSEEDLDDFQSAFENETPGRNPPTWVMRKLRMEAGHLCGFCRLPNPLQYHHLIEWNKIKHFDPSAMIAICGSCHDKASRGQIDRQEQMLYKGQLQFRTLDILGLDSQFQGLMSTGQATSLLISVINQISIHLENDASVALDQFITSNIPAKNALNGLSDSYYRTMLEEDDIHVAKIDLLLKTPSRQDVKGKYYSLCNEVRRKLTVYQNHGLPFEFCLMKLYDFVSEKLDNPSELELRALRALISFMYLNCDIGKKR